MIYFIVISAFLLLIVASLLIKKLFTINSITETKVIIPVKHEIVNGIIHINFSDLAVLWVDGIKNDDKTITNKAEDKLSSTVNLENMYSYDLFKNNKNLLYTKSRPFKELVDDGKLWYEKDDFINHLISKIKLSINRSELDCFVFNNACYVKTRFIWQKTKDFAMDRMAAELIEYENNDEKRRTAMLFIVQELKKLGFLNNSTIKKGYFGTSIIILLMNDKKEKGFYLTLKAEKFGEYCDLPCVSNIINKEEVLP